MAIDVTSFFLYRYRYILGYGFIGLILIGLLILAGIYAPGGISNTETNAVIKSAGVSITDISSLAVTDLPYHLLQQTSMQLFGVSNLSIKLPSLILALFSGIGLIILLRRWFKANIAVLASVIAVTTGQFLFIAQSGTTGILYVLWPVLLLLIGTLVAKKAKFQTFWKITFFIVAALSLYTPLSIYALVALGFAGVLHPHLRYIIRHLSKVRLVIACLIGAAIVAPLVLGIIKTPSLGLSLLGVPTEMPDFLANIATLGKQYLGFAIPTTTNLMTPVFGLGSMLIIGFGIYKLIRTRESTQSYLIITWIVCLIPILITNPRFTSVTFLPLVLLLATGLSSLLNNWYRLFPRNPYARITGLIPLFILISALVLSGLERYAYGYHYDPQTVPNFSKDLSLLPKDTKQLIVTGEELPFYRVVESYNKSFKIVNQPTADTFVSTQPLTGMYPGYEISRIITTSTYNNADRFYVYKKIGS